MNVKIKVPFNFLDDYDPTIQTAVLCSFFLVEKLNGAYNGHHPTKAVSPGISPNKPQYDSNTYPSPNAAKPTINLRVRSVLPMLRFINPPFYYN